MLDSARLRYLDSLEPPMLAKVLTATGAQALVSGTVYAFSDSRNPIVAVAARIVRADGTVVWSDVAALSADDTERVLGFGRENDRSGVAAAVIERLTRRMPGPDMRPAIVDGPSKGLFQSGPASFRSRDLDTARQRVCVLPFDNLSSLPEAGRVVTDLVALRLAAARGFDLVEPSTLRAAALQARIGSFRGIGSDDLAKLADAVGTPLFVRGTVYSFADPAGRPGIVPELQVELSLVDVRAGRTLWVAQHARKGSDYIGFLMRGSVSNAISLTDRVVSEMIDAEERGRPRGEAGAKTARAAKARQSEKHSELRKEK
jgi:TolB-like protein